MNPDTFPQTLVAAIRHFADPQVSFDFMKALRWGSGPVCCPRCGGDKTTFISTRRTWECKGTHAQRQFSVKTGTIFEDSPLPLDKWLATIWLIANAKNGISSYEVHRAIHVTQKTAWFMLHRVRLAMQTGTFEKLKGTVEVDETYIGGRGRFMHESRKKRIGMGTGHTVKQTVVGMLERGGEVRAMHVQNPKSSTLLPLVKEAVESGSEVHTDSLRSYAKLSKDFVHQMVDHAEEYVRGNVHTNSMENFWSCLKRTLKGTYISVDPAHLFRYLDEQVCRFNNRKTNDASRFLTVVSAIVGRRITYKELIGKAGLPA